MQLLFLFRDARVRKIEKNEELIRQFDSFRILVTSESSGLIETITDAVSIHSIKKIAYSRTAADGTVFTSYSLYDYYVETFGPPNSTGFKRAQTAFIKSLAAYSVICYLLQLKDRHNGNILVDRSGHLIRTSRLVTLLLPPLHECDDTSSKIETDSTQRNRYRFRIPPLKLSRLTRIRNGSLQTPSRLY